MFGPSRSQSVASQVAEAQGHRLWIQMCPKGVVPTTTDEQKLFLFWQKDTAVIV